MRYSCRLYSFSCYSLRGAVASRSAVAPLSVLESDAKIYIKIYLSSTFTIFNITLTFVYN